MKNLGYIYLRKNVKLKIFVIVEDFDRERIGGDRAYLY